MLLLASFFYLSPVNCGVFLLILRYKYISLDIDDRDKKYMDICYDGCRGNKCIGWNHLLIHWLDICICSERATRGQDSSSSFSSLLYCLMASPHSLFIQEERFGKPRRNHLAKNTQAINFRSQIPTALSIQKRVVTLGKRVIMTALRESRKTIKIFVSAKEHYLKNSGNPGKAWSLLIRLFSLSSSHLFPVFFCLGLVHLSLFQQPQS